MVLRVHEKTVATWVGRFCCEGLSGVLRHKPTGRPPQLTPTRQAVLATLIDEGPIKAGFSSACWRSPMIQQLIYERFGVFYNVFSTAQLPSDSPDDHPIEKLWKKVQKEGTHLQYFPSFAALREKVEHALLTFANTPAEILALCSLPSELAQVA